MSNDISQGCGCSVLVHRTLIPRTASKRRRPRMLRAPLPSTLSSMLDHVCCSFREYTEATVFDRMIIGVILASTTRKLRVPYTFKFWSTTPPLSQVSIAHVPTGCQLHNANLRTLSFASPVFLEGAHRALRRPSFLINEASGSVLATVPSV